MVIIVPTNLMTLLNQLSIQPGRVLTGALTGVTIVIVSEGIGYHQTKGAAGRIRAQFLMTIQAATAINAFGRNAPVSQVAKGRGAGQPLRQAIEVVSLDF